MPVSQERQGATDRAIGKWLKTNGRARDEVIIASKVAGSDRGFSYNTARSSNFDFYENTVEFNIKTISPIADNGSGVKSLHK